MNTFIAFIGIVIVIISVVLAIINQTKKAYSTKKKPAFVLLVIGIAIFVLGCSFEIVPTGYTGVRTTFGQISDTTVPQGFNFKVPFVQTIELVNNKQQDILINNQVWGETKEKTPVYASDIIVTYKIDGQKSAWIFANVSESDNNLIDDNIVASSVKSAMVELTTTDVTVRSKIEPMVKEKLTQSLNEKYGESTVLVLKVVVNNMDFEQSYNEAIAAKSIAQQTYEKQQIENNTAIAKAEADKKVKITNAEAEAEAKQIAAEAEAKANELLTSSLTDEILKSKFYEKWDGKLPTVMSDGSVITDIGDITK